MVKSITTESFLRFFLKHIFLQIKFCQFGLISADLLFIPANERKWNKTQHTINTISNKKTGISFNSILLQAEFSSAFSAIICFSLSRVSDEMKSFLPFLSLLFISHSVLGASDTLVDNEIKEEVTAWNHEALNITVTACKHYMNQLVEKKLLFSNMSVPLAIQVKEAMEELEKIKEHESYEDLHAQFKRIVEDLPLSVVTLIWGSKTHLFNKYHAGEYLYVVYDEEADEDKRSVYTWTPGGRDPVGIWEFSTDDDGQSFFITNSEYKEPFYAGDDSLAYDKSRRNVYTWRKETSDEKRWIVEIQGDEEIMIKSKDRGEYFYAGYSSFVEGKRRKVFNWRESSPCDDTCVWILSPEKDSIASRLNEETD